MRRDDLWTLKKYLYPLLALVLAFILWTETKAEVIPVKHKDGKLCLIDTKPKWPVTEFSVCYPAGRLDRR